MRRKSSDDRSVPLTVAAATCPAHQPPAQEEDQGHLGTSQGVEIGSRRAARELFTGLPAAQPEDLLGRWDGRMLGEPALVGLAKTVALVTPSRAWCGKDFKVGGRVVNLAMRQGRVTPVQDGITSFGTSRLDGLPAAVVDYRETAAPPTRWMRGEVRWVAPGSVALGMLFLPVGSHVVLGPFPYLLTRPGRG